MHSEKAEGMGQDTALSWEDKNFLTSPHLEITSNIYSF